ncbi:MAG: TSUP family transporter [Natronospirillum sp.]|uniref:TSUP family transporter n=1 Tax=Natronospirillum sp. TaxID=2812955 RepID=UPI0025DB710E|nr:TSUP family transporter [Natronospirillum sp.]MCH8552384.1 TSUP family transporter [Natronospirillum sp.]
MELLSSPDILAMLFLAALIAGFVDALAGGGGLITLPTLLLAQVPPVAALATNKLQASFGTLTASWRMLHSGMVRWQDVKGLFWASVVGAASGALLVQFVDPGILQFVIPIVLIGMALYYLLIPGVVAASRPRISERSYRLGLAPGIGFYDGFFGPGTGSLFAFTRNSLRGDSLLESTAKAKIMNFGSNVAALVLFIAGGHVAWLAGGIMIIGVLIGSSLGSHLVVRGAVHWIRPMIVIVCVAMAGRYFWAEAL